MDILENLLPRPSRRGLAIVNTIILLSFAGTLIWAGLLLSQRSGTMTASMLGIRMSVVYGVVALSGALDVIFLLARLALLLFDPEAANPPGEGDGAIDTAL